MMSNNKILTVSYGTFSCTLEGFDDSFGTMKAIAEYFRGLSSDAPYFGAEPPQPDADMLARIAQREISRRVEAREHEGKIHLSAIEKHAKDEGAAPQFIDPSPVNDDIIADTAKVAAAAVVPVVTDPVADQDETPNATEEAQVDDAPEAALAPAPPADKVEEAAEAAEEDTADEVEKAPSAASSAQDEPTQEQIEDDNDIVPGQPDADVEAFFANSTDIEILEDDEDLAAQDGPNDSIAAKLQRIRAVVAQHDDTDDEDDFVEDQHAEADAEPQIEPDHIMADARRDIEDALEADEAADEAGETDASDDDEDDIAAILSRFDAEEDAGEEIALTQSDTIDPADDAPENLFGDDAREKEDMGEKIADVIESDVSQDAAQAPRARVIKVKRVDLEAAIENGELEEYVDENEGENTPSLNDLAPTKSAGSSLSAEDEAELARELADLEADMSPEEFTPSDDLADAGDLVETEDLDGKDALDIRAEDDTSLTDQDAERIEDQDEGNVDTVDEPTTTSRHVLPSIDDARGEDMDRLLAETDQQMDEPESATRRNAFSHLRAAVAAKKADFAMGASSDKTDEEDNEYRSDLADVVRPRRPVSGSARTERPGDARPAPLKLVAEQRIDVAGPRAAGPVRPRRVAAVSEGSFVEPDGESFADYAAGMGATKLPQLLEAAAAYMSFVEGREQFSRPQLMTKVRQVGPEEGFSREDGLRSFGQLLRAGKIEKIKGGRFTVSEDIGYRPDHRAAS